MSVSTLSGWGRTLEMCVLIASCSLFPVPDGDEWPRLRAGVDGGGADDLVVDTLLDDVRGPAAGAGDDENRREHRRGHAHPVVGDRGEPVQVREHLLLAHHYFLDEI